jgi:hypothetical protein
VRQFSQGTVAQKGAAEGWEKQQHDFTSLSTVQNVFITVRYRTQELATGDGLRRVCRFVIFDDWHIWGE